MTPEAALEELFTLPHGALFYETLWVSANSLRKAMGLKGNRATWRMLMRFGVAMSPKQFWQWCREQHIVFTGEFSYGKDSNPGLGYKFGPATMPLHPGLGYKFGPATMSLHLRDDIEDMIWGSSTGGVEAGR